MPARYRAFGGFRFALALTVVLSHTWFLTFPERNFIQNIGIGNFAVMGFFVLSGFIISEAIDTFYSQRAGAFTANRLLRLVPPYWVAAMVSIAVHLVVSKAGALKLPDYDLPPADIFDARNLAVQITAIIPVLNVNQLMPAHEWYYFVRFAWAIFVEFVFYFSAAGCVLIWPLAKRFFSLRTYLACCSLGAVGIHIINEFVRPLHGSFRFTPYFVLGAAIYWALTRADRVAWAIAAACYALICVHFSRYTQGQISASSDWWSGMILPVFALPTAIMLAIPAALIFLASVRLTPSGKKIDQFLGDLTYPLYLNHYAVLVVAYSWLPAGHAAVQILAVLASITVAWILHIAVEVPMSPVRDRLRGHPLLSPVK